MAIEGILFDKDGTLLDFQATWVPVIHEAALAAAGQEAARAELLLAVGGYDAETGLVRSGSLLAAGNTTEIAAAWAARLPATDTGELVALLDRIFQQGGAVSARPVAELAPLLARLKARGLALGVATSDSRRGAEASLAPFGILELLDFIAGYDSGHGAKPGPGMVEGFCAATGLAAGSVAVVGDNLHDLEMGRRAGTGLVVGVLTGTSDRGELAPFADHVLDSIAGLEALLDRL
jgi:phosphoglycolate phosphatase